MRSIHVSASHSIEGEKLLLFCSLSEGVIYDTHNTHSDQKTFMKMPKFILVRPLLSGVLSGVST